MLPSSGLGQRRPYYAPETPRLVRRIQASQQQTCRPEFEQVMAHRLSTAVDYSLAPAHPFPAAHDVVTA